MSNGVSLTPSLEDLNIIPENIAEGIVILGVTGTLTGGSSECYVGPEAPDDTSIMWIDTSGSTPILKQYNSSSSSWVAVSAVWG